MVLERLLSAFAMTELFEFGYALLCVLVILEAAVFQEILRRTVRLKRLYAASLRAKPRELSPGVAAPEFTAPVLGTGGTLNTSNLKGHVTILLFVSPTEASSPLYERLSVAIHALWHKAKGKLYMVCSGGEEDCRRIARAHRVDGFKGKQVPVILDEGGRIAESLLIRNTPQAVVLDKDARIRRYGKPLLSME